MSWPSCPGWAEPVTPRRIAIGAVVLSVVAVLIGVLVGRRIESPADAALDAQPPASGPITVPVERRVLSADLRIRGTLGAVDSTEVTLAASSIGPADDVVVSAPAVGDTVNEGDVILEVGNRPVIALVGDLPMYRDLGPGDLGDDVRLIEEALGRLGYFAKAADDTWDADTSAALDRLYTDRKFAPIGAPPEVTEEVGRLNAEAEAAAKGGDAAALKQADQALHGGDILQARHVGQHHRIGREQRSAQLGQRGVLGARDAYLALQAAATADQELVHAWRIFKILVKSGSSAYT